MTDSRNLTEKRGMNRDTIKYIAMITMLLNHVSFIFLEPGTVLAEILTAVGYFTAPVMCYFLVEGMTYTRSPKKIWTETAFVCCDFGASLLPGHDRGRNHRLCGNGYAVYAVFMFSDHKSHERDHQSSKQKSCSGRADSSVSVL